MQETREIWQIIDSGRFGGIESHIKELSIGLQKVGIKVRVIFLEDYGKHPLRSELEKHAIACNALDGKLTSFVSLSRSYQPLLFHTHGYKANFLIRLVGKLMRTPTVSTFHSGMRGEGRVGFYNFIDETTSFLGKRISVDESISRRILWKTHVIPNFVKLPKNESSNYIVKRKKIAFVGRLNKEKGPDEFCKLATHYPEIQFHVFGDGPLFSMLKQKYSDHVKFFGTVKNMDDFWDEYDFLCMTSKHEGLPLVALEAFAHRVPVIAYAVGGLRGLIDHGCSGFLVEPGNIKALAEQIFQFYQLSTDEINQIKDNAYNKIEASYSSEVIIPKIIAFYEGALR